MELGLHITDFTWTGGTEALGGRLARHVKNAEDAGISRITVMDHQWQIPGIGPATDDMLEAYTALGFVAAHTTKARLHTLVTGVVYREPALLAKQIATLDTLSGGRAGLGIGAAWFEDEARGLGFRFPSAKERLERLEEAIEICIQLWSGDESPYVGKYYNLERPMNFPKNLSGRRPYVLIGGEGEKKTLRMVAKYADACNFGTSPDAGRKLDVLRKHCDAVDRDFDSIEKTYQVRIDSKTTSNELSAVFRRMEDLGFTVAYVYSSGISEPERVIEMITSSAI